MDDSFVRDFSQGIGAEIMGRNTSGPQRGLWQDEQWQGRWGDEPPFHTPVLVLTHHARPSFTLGDTTFHFVSGEPADVLATARAAAAGRDVRLGGGAGDKDAHDASLEPEDVRVLIQQARPLIAGMSDQTELTVHGGEGLPL